MLALSRTQEASISPLGLIFQKSISGSPTHPAPLSLTRPPIPQRPGYSYQEVAVLPWPLLGCEVDCVLTWPLTSPSPWLLPTTPPPPRPRPLHIIQPSPSRGWPALRLLPLSSSRLWPIVLCGDPPPPTPPSGSWCRACHLPAAAAYVRSLPVFVSPTISSRDRSLSGKNQESSNSAPSFFHMGKLEQQKPGLPTHRSLCCASLWTYTSEENL